MDSQKKILLAEDDDVARNFLALILRRAGFDVTEVENGFDALETMLTEDFDAVVADDMMPIMPGHDLCRILRAHAKTADIPFIILSGSASLVAKSREEDLADACLLKTGNLRDELVSALTEIFKARPVASP